MKLHKGFFIIAALLFCTVCASAVTSLSASANLPAQHTAEELEQQGIVLEDSKISGKPFLWIDGDFAGFPIRNENDAVQAVASVSELFGCTNFNQELRYTRSLTGLGFTHYYFRQYINGIPVTSDRTVLTVDADTQTVNDL